MNYFPIFIDLKGQAVAVVGGGDVAARKVRLLLRAGARPRIIARRLCPELLDQLNDGRLDWLAREYADRHLDGARLVYAATDDQDLNRRVHAEAERRGIPVNVVDHRALCRFITPAMIDRDPVQIAISSGGASPVLARKLRGWLERLLPAGLGRVARAAGRLRPWMAGWPLERRRRAWDALLDRRTVSAWSRLPQKEIDQRMRRALEGPTAGHAGGMVYLVGAGPGDPGLLTVRAMQVLGQADVILYDRLVGPDVLDLARRDAEFIDVGKRAGGRRCAQEDIHRQMLEHARLGRQVVRLKGGDGFIFGRGGEELEWLRAHGIEYEVVPGITAATGCAAFSGIPLTHRDHAQVLTLATGHGAGEDAARDWAGLAGRGKTLVIYMGLGKAAQLRAQLIEAGIDPQLPASIVVDGTRPGQQVLHGSVDGLPGLAAGVRRGSPALIIVGDVAALGSQLNWFAAAAAVEEAA